MLIGLDSTKIQRAVGAFDKVWNPLLQDDKRNRTNAAKMFFDFGTAHHGSNGLYTLVHPSELPFVQRITLPPDDQVSEYEIVFAVDIGLDQPLVGRIDGIGRLRDSGELVLLEFKTTSYTYNFFNAFQLSPQVLLYNLGAKISGVPVKKCVVEALEVSKTKNSTLAMPITIQDHHIEEALEWARFFGRLYLECERTGNFPKWFSGCHSYAMFGQTMGSYLCDYQNLCSPPKWTQNVSLYVQRADKRYEVLGSVT